MLKISTGITKRQIYSRIPKSRNYAATVTGGITGIGQPQTLKVSRTRGTPSTRTDLKEALLEKIPLHYDLLRKFRTRYGNSVVSHITVNDLYQGLKGVSTAVRETSEIDPKLGVKYRGLTIPEVVALLPRRGNSPCPEAVFWLLLTGDIPSHEQTASLTADWISRRQRRREWWAEKGGGIVGTVLKTLPENVSPLGRLCVALTTLRADKHMRDALKIGATTHTHWEYTYEDCMELLATLPTIVGLVSQSKSLDHISDEGDWVDLLLDCLGNVAADDKGKKSSLGEFLRLYITVNADEDSGSPGAHMTQILGYSTLDPSQALAAGVMAYADEPQGGSMLQCMDFQAKLQNALGCEPTETAMKSYLGLLVDREILPSGYKESEFCDPRYMMLRNFARERLPDAPQIKLSRSISKVLIPMLKEAKSKNTWPEPNAIAAPIFQYYGLRDMEFNQVLLCMSRALGAVASIIWAKAINAPVERPRSHSTYTYVETQHNVQVKTKKYPVEDVKRFLK
ncbi:probable citrate synthase 2, mitochondrial [Athalia rosae]|uniref:probable citrate synthase 2, mitochondrial n=1 Tax=Athalia rosae TaxID=37344 RepID=UPI00203345E3|nr:probable citrate synthase 2, mitochondrial [Athalia rosae]